jgi:hypothetical protein
LVLFVLAIAGCDFRKPNLGAGNQNNAASNSSPGSNPITQDSQNLQDAITKSLGTLSSKGIEGADNGILGCGWAFNQVLQRAGYASVGSNPMYTPSIYQALVSGADGAKEVAAPVAGQITVIITPSDSQGHGHVGFVGTDGQTVYSNSSSTGLFSQNYSVDSWTGRQSNSRTHYFVLGSPGG